MNMDVCGGGSETPWFSWRVLGVEELGCWIDLSGERPLALDVGVLRTTSLSTGKPRCGLSSGKIELVRPRDDCDGISAMSEAELGSWKMFRRRVDAIDDEVEPCLHHQNLILDASRRVDKRRRSSRMDVVVINDDAGRGSHAVSVPPRLHLSCGQKESKNTERNRSACLITKGKQR